MLTRILHLRFLPFLFWLDYVLNGRTNEIEAIFFQKL
jgi:hypothetical protein